ncbi:MAG TPA: DNA-formamidopyrimidine glycosylase family protein [Chloroflexota bacterium]|nr:DNA-formamidopyrimidine glycosylase family protein [Chloroflexota bacterium]
MPELPDVTVYVEALTARIVGQPIEHVRLASPFLVRTAVPSIRSVEGKSVVEVSRLGKRIVLRLDRDELILVLHLMIAGRLHWRPRGAKVPGRIGLAAFDFPNGSLILTEASTKKRAALHLVQGEAALGEFDRGGIDVFAAPPAEFAAAIRRENHTVKRALTDPRLFDGIGNAYSDEILHRARISPLKLTRRLSDAEIDGLCDATRRTLAEWIDRLRADAGVSFPEKVTAFRPEMAVHGRYGQPCPECGTSIQRIVYAENEANYCPTCQTGGRLLADRALSRLLQADWPRTLDDLEQRRAANRETFAVKLS